MLHSGLITPLVQSPGVTSAIRRNANERHVEIEMAFWGNGTRNTEQVTPNAGWFKQQHGTHAMQHAKTQRPAFATSQIAMANECARQAQLATMHQDGARQSEINQGDVQVSPPTLAGLPMMCRIGLR